MKYKIIAFLFLCVALTSLTTLVSPYGLENPEPIDPFLNNKFPKNSPALGEWKVVNAFPEFTFVDPVAMQQIPGTQDFMIAEKPGAIVVLTLADNGNYEKKTILDINEKVITSGDAGLINFILHPDFGKSGAIHENYVYAYYAFHPEIEDGEVERVNKFVRFTVINDEYDIDVNSEYVLIQDYDPQGYHMGGGMFFDEEGYFYLTFGDGGSTNNALGSTQQITDRFWGGIIRIDLDNDATRSHPIRRDIKDYYTKPDFLPAAITQGYMIPNTNPFLSEDGEFLEEFYALGLRSPHRANYDAETGEIWIGDVGEGSREEITVLKKAGNGQWPYMEGKALGPKEKPDVLIGTDNPPIYDYQREEGNSIIGGFVYRGEKWQQQLDGLYIYGDHGSRNVWSFNPVTNENTLLVNIPEFGEGNKSGLASFGTDDEGNVYILKLYGKNRDGAIIYKLEIEDSEPEPIPFLLSETEAFSELNNLTPNLGIIPYNGINPLWSDGAKKKRWIALANDGTHDSPEEQITFFDKDDWQFPGGTVFIKHFDLPIDHRDPTITKKIETRFFIIDVEGNGYGLTYRWYEDESDAYLLESGEKRVVDIIDEMGINTTQEWTYPSRVQCISCHNANSSFVLGVNTYQLNGNITYPQTGVSANQLETWNHLGMFSQAMSDEEINKKSRAVALDDDSASLQDKVVSYLAANCAYCHRPDGVEGAFDARFDTPMAFKNLINAGGKSHNNPAGGVIVKPGFHDQSQLWIRDNSIDKDKMPPIAKSIVDKEWIDVLTQWIDGLDETCVGTLLSDLDWAADPINGYGPVEINQSNGENLPEDGNIMSINGREFEKGLGVHAYSELIYVLDEEYVQFNSYIGVDDESCDRASLQFVVMVDNDVVYRSETMTTGQDARFVSVDLEGAMQMKLIVTSPHSLEECDHANWADAKLLKSRDSDGDGVCDNNDMCEGADDNIDTNFDGIPDGCENIEKGGEIEMKIGPNPFSDAFVIRLKQPENFISKAVLVLTDLNGRIMYRDNHVNFETDYKLGENLPSGAFILRVKTGSFSNTAKLVKLP